MWPVPSDYDEAIQNPHVNLLDPELRQGRPELDDFGGPVVCSGNFAAVYLLHAPTRNLAVRCFIREVKDQQERYAAVAARLARLKVPYIVDFSYLEQGIRVEEQWYPIVKMDWVDGDLLDIYLEKNLDRPDKLAALAASWLDMSRWFRGAGIAHGDLQHGNVIVVNDRLRLVDYDGMFVQSLSGRLANEIGIDHYQHPGRDYRHYGPYLDNFSDWVIYTTLVALSVDKYLWGRVNIEDKHLIFTRDDYKDPSQSELFRRLLNHADGRLRLLAMSLRNCLTYDFERVPELNPDEPVAPQPISGRALSQSTPSLAQQARSAIDRAVSASSQFAGKIQRASQAGRESRQRQSTSSFKEHLDGALSFAHGGIAADWYSFLYRKKLVLAASLIVLVGLVAGGTCLLLRQPAEDEVSSSLFVEEADKLFEKGDYRKAIELYDKATRVDVTNFQAALQRARAYSRLNDTEAALKNLDQALLIDPGSAAAHAERGEVLSKKGKFTDAIRDFSFALDKDPQNHAAYVGRGVAYSKAGRLKDALIDFTLALKLDPRNATALSGRGGVLRMSRQYPAAIADYSAAIKLSPSNANIYNNRGLSYHLSDKLQQAISDYTKAISLDPTDGDFYNNRGLAYKSLGKWDSAVEDLTRAIELYPASDRRAAEALKSRAALYAARGQYKQSVQDYAAAVAVSPASAEGYLGRGMALQKTGNLREALADFDLAVAREPNAPELYLVRGLAYRQGRKYSEALGDLQMARKLYEAKGDKASARDVALLEQALKSQI